MVMLHFNGREKVTSFGGPNLTEQVVMLQRWSV